MKKLFASLLALCLLFSLCACELPGKKTPAKPQSTEAPEETLTPEETPEPTEAPDPRLGKYELVACLIGDTYIEAAAFSEGSYVIDLRKNGRASLYEDDDRTSAKYTLDGDEITITEDDDTVTGTLADDMITVLIPDEDELLGKIYMVFTKEGRDNSDLQILSLDEYLELLLSQEGPGPVSGQLSGANDNYAVEIVGVEEFDDFNDSPAVRIYYDFTNLSDESISAAVALSITARQDGDLMDETYTLEDLPYEFNNCYDVRPGVTVRCFVGYSIDPDGGPLRLQVEDWWEDDILLDVALDPRALPAPPAPWAGLTPIEDPTWTDEMDWEGVLGDFYVYIDSAEMEYDDDDNDCVRVYFELTNISDETARPDDLNYRLFQDGMQLEVAYGYEVLDADEAMYAEVKPGDTVIASRVFVLRSDSPFEVEVNCYWTDDEPIGGVFA